MIEQSVLVRGVRSSLVSAFRVDIVISSQRSFLLRSQMFGALLCWGGLRLSQLCRASSLSLPAAQHPKRAYEREMWSYIWFCQQ